jgi:hypothetical protein
MPHRPLIELHKVLQLLKFSSAATWLQVDAAKWRRFCKLFGWTPFAGHGRKTDPETCHNPQWYTSCLVTQLIFPDRAVLSGQFGPTSMKQG